MADLVTHLCTALLPGAFVRGRLLGPVVVGTVLPDLASRVPALALEAVDRAGWWSVPDDAFFPWGVLHEPVGVLLVVTLACAAVVERDRADVFVGILGGCALHLGLDLLQDHHGQGYYLAAPFSARRFELGWIGSEATVPLAPWFALTTAFAWALTSSLRGRRGAAAAR